MTNKSIRIGCASGFWGDTSTAAAQLVESGNLDYLVFDYLAEVTMSILATQRMRDPTQGYAKDFVKPVMSALLADIKAQGITVIANAGGVNPLACRDALLAEAAEQGIDLKVAVVLGDDLAPRKDEFIAAGMTEMASGAELPARIVSMNAYLGAFPVAHALASDVDIVVTGRCVDSAVVLGPLIHEFAWTAEQYDELAAGSLAGHILECGAQCTGGNFTDWELVADGYANMGFPIAEVTANGDFVVSKPPNTGGLVSVGTVAEQMLYEIGDPRAYLLPDVVCDFTQVTLTEQGANEVAVSGASGLPPSEYYKVSATYPTGYRATALFVIGGISAAQKGQVVAQAILDKTSQMNADLGLGPYSATDIEILGSEAMYGPNARAAAADVREVMVKIAVQAPNKAALVVFSKEIAQAATGMAPSVTGYFGGRPKITPVIQLFSCLVHKDQVPIHVDVHGEQTAVVAQQTAIFKDDLLAADTLAACVPPIISEPVMVPLLKLAYARSGDKGDHANIGVIAREPEYFPYIAATLTEQVIADYFAHLLNSNLGSTVSRWELPGVAAMNVLLTHALGGGGIASLRADPQGKCFAQMLLDYPVAVPAALAAELEAASTAKAKVKAKAKAKAKARVGSA